MGSRFWSSNWRDGFDSRVRISLQVLRRLILHFDGGQVAVIILLRERERHDENMQNPLLESRAVGRSS